MTSFLEGIMEKDPSERVKHSFTRDLELRRKNPKTVEQFSAYVYLGGADLLLREGEFWQGRPTPPEFESLRGPKNECFWNALDAAEADPRLRYCEGYYTTGFGVQHTHAWCIDESDQLVELTFPTDEEYLRPAFRESGMAYVGPAHWGYYGVTVAVSFVRAHADKHGMPMLDRAPGELVNSALQGRGEFFLARSREDTRAAIKAEQHDYPILKVKYDPNRTELP